MILKRRREGYRKVGRNVFFRFVSFRLGQRSGGTKYQRPKENKKKKRRKNKPSGIPPAKKKKWVFFFFFVSRLFLYKMFTKGLGKLKS